jgi:hypothetical protein
MEKIVLLHLIHGLNHNILQAAKEKIGIIAVGSGLTDEQRIRPLLLLTKARCLNYKILGLIRRPKAEENVADFLNVTAESYRIYLTVRYSPRDEGITQQEYIDSLDLLWKHNYKKVLDQTLLIQPNTLVDTFRESLIQINKYKYPHPN